MEYIIDDRYKITPYNNGLCYDLYEFREVISKRTGESKGEQWAHTGKYPTSFAQALFLIYEMEVKRGEGTIEGLDAAIKHARSIEQRIKKGIKKNG